MTTSIPRSQHWQLAPDGAGITQGADDIDLCIRHILSTRKGSDVLRPDFGSNHFDYLDTPEDVFRPNAVREIVLAVQTWEKRAVVERVSFDGNAPHLFITVEWRIADSLNLAENAVYTTGLST